MTVPGCAFLDPFSNYRGVNLIASGTLADWTPDSGTYLGYGSVGGETPPIASAPVYRLELLNLIPNGDFDTGSMEPFTADTRSIPIARREHGGDVFGSSIYLTGGRDGTNAALGDTPRVSVTGGCLAGTGNCLSAWSTFSAFGSLAGPRYGHGSVIHLNNLHILGGRDDTSTVLDNVWFIDP